MDATTTKQPDWDLMTTTLPWFKWVIATITGIWVGLPVAVRILFVLSCADFITGYLMAWRMRKWDYHEAINGIVNKFSLFLFVGAINYVSNNLKMPMDLGSGVAFALAANELGSLFRNCSGLGVHVPEQALGIMSALRGRAGRKRRRR
jgi:toxin secretion/phage lysis holin